MMPPARETRPTARGVSPEFRAGLFQFTVFAPTGVASVYFAIWLANQGLTADQIGLINAAPVLLLLAASMLVGRLADRASDWRQVIVALALLAGVAPFGFLFVDEFWGILLVWTLCASPAGALVPVIDAASLRMTQRRGTDFGSIRAWATVGYMVTTASTGPLVAIFGAAAFLPLFIFFSLLRAVLGFQLPRFRVPADSQVVVATPLAGRLLEVMRPWFVLPILGAALLVATHMVLGVFAALIWKQQGISEGVIGLLIAIGPLSEAAMMFVWRRTGARVPARTLLIIACLVGTVRWTAMAFEPPIWGLVLLQLSHGITFAFGFFGLMHFIANWTGEEIAAEAQGFAAALGQGMTVLGLSLFGWLAAAVGGRAFLMAAVFTLIGAACIWVSLRLRPAHTHVLPAEGRGRRRGPAA